MAKKIAGFSKSATIAEGGRLYGSEMAAVGKKDSSDLLFEFLHDPGKETVFD